MHFIVSNVDSEEKTYKIQNVYNLVQSACLSWDVHLLNFKDSEFKADFHQKVTGSIQCKKHRKKKNSNQGDPLSPFSPTPDIPTNVVSFGATTLKG